MSFERFDIRDRETGEWIHDLTREMLAQYVLGKLPGYDIGRTLRRYEPLRDEVHHTICCGDGTVYYDGEMVIPGKRE